MTKILLCNTMYYRKDVFHMTFSLRLNDEDAELIKRYAELNGMTVSDLLRSSVMARIEDELDLKTYHAAMAEFSKDPVTFTLDEVERELGLQ